MDRDEAYAALDELYAQLPALECKGRCHDTCTAIDMSVLERERIEEATGVRIPLPLYPPDRNLVDGVPPRCVALGPLNTCRVYAVRPFICRAFGMVLTNPDEPHSGPMMCDYGCIPDAVLSAPEFARIMRSILELSEAVTGRELMVQRGRLGAK